MLNRFSAREQLYVLLQSCYFISRLSIQLLPFIEHLIELLLRLATSAIT
ncbi:Uncharacterised protein [Vibrio cholerae]|nr:Uncharacterised protein [Vibrio cholerae]